eukprot:PhF_6_TR27376/c0_g1_i2/m.40282
MVISSTSQPPPFIPPKYHTVYLHKHEKRRGDQFPTRIGIDAVSAVVASCLVSGVIMARTGGTSLRATPINRFAGLAATGSAMFFAANLVDSSAEHQGLFTPPIGTKSAITMGIYTPFATVLQRNPKKVFLLCSIRDLITTFSAFSFPDLFCERGFDRPRTYNMERIATTIAMPMIAQIFVTPLHLLAFDESTRIGGAVKGHSWRVIRDNYVRAVPQRMLMTGVFFGCGAVLNDVLHANIRKYVS